MNSTKYLYAIVAALSCGCTGLISEECDEDCAADQFCKLPSGDCGDGGQAGVCEDVPDVCIEIFEPVCGCDGETYGNECKAAMAGVSVAHEGECDPEPQTCGGIAGAGCPDDQYCRLEVGTCCCDFTGLCTEIPLGCPDVVDPVCGCDGVTYGNDCEAAMLVVSIDHEGECDQTACCDPDRQPGVGDNPTCIEGVTCCADGVWRCNAGDGTTICDEVGNVCAPAGRSAPGGGRPGKERPELSAGP